MITDLRADDHTPVAEGKYINIESRLTDYLCSRPYYVAVISGSHIYYVDHRDVDDWVQGRMQLSTLKYCHRKTVQFMTDTLSEGLALLKIAQNKSTEVEESVRKVRQDLRKKYEGQIEALIQTTLTPEKEAA